MPPKRRKRQDNSKKKRKIEERDACTPQPAKKKAKSGDGDLTAQDIQRLANIISKGDMESIALGYFKQDWNRVRTHKDDLRSTEEFNRAILMDWKIANPGMNQKKRLTTILNKAANESSYVDPQKVRDVLKVDVKDTESDEGVKLTEEMINKLAGLITNSTELNTFAIRGLRMTGAQVANHLTKYQPSSSRTITNDELSYIASKMSSDNMTKFSEKFLNIKRNQWGYNYALLKYWKKYAGENAEQDLMEALSRGAAEGLIDYDHIPDELQNSRRKAPELIDEMLEKLSRQIKTKGELRVLTITGLGMASERVKTHLQNNVDDFTTAVFDLLQEWRNSQEDRETAYEWLRKGLDKCNLEHYISVALKPQ